MNKWYITLTCFILMMVKARAQPGLPEMDQARQDLDQSFFSAIDFSLILAAIFGIIGAVRIFYNWQMGKERITADISAWFFAALFVVLMGAFLRAIFGL